MKLRLPILFLPLLLTNAHSQVVINEIMFHAPHAQGDAEPFDQEYIELLNAGSESVSLSGWQIDRGFSFTFGATSLAPGEILVVAADLAAFQATYPAVTKLVGGWAGQLSNSGEGIRLVDSAGATIDSVNYADQGDWPSASARSTRESPDEPGSHLPMALAWRWS